MIKKAVSLLVLFISILEAKNHPVFENKYNKCSKNKINEISVIGERCSGTKFVRDLLRENFPKCKIDPNWNEVSHRNKYGHKHFFPWLDLSEFGIQSKNGSHDTSHLRGSDRTLFVFVVRNVYDWLRSFYARPHHIDLKDGEDFKMFISSEWETSWRRMPFLIDEVNPYFDRKFTNVLELRKYKILNFLSLRNHVKNFVVVRYEDINMNRKEFLAFLAKRFHLKRNASCHLLSKSKSAYPPFDPNILEWVNNKTDWKTESRVGYHLQGTVK